MGKALKRLKKNDSPFFSFQQHLSPGNCAALGLERNINDIVEICDCFCTHNIDTSTFALLTRARRAEFCNCLFLRASCSLNISFQMGCSQICRKVSHLSFLLSGWSSGSAALNENPSDFDLGIEGVPPWCSPSK